LFLPKTNKNRLVFNLCTYGFVFSKFLFRLIEKLKEENLRSCYYPTPLMGYIKEVSLPRLSRNIKGETFLKEL